jgi:hypothetical protein
MWQIDVEGGGAGHKPICQYGPSRAMVDVAPVASGSSSTSTWWLLG